MVDDKILRGVVKNLSQLGMETIEKVGQEGEKIVEDIITGKELLGLERTMSDDELDQSKRQEKIKSQQEISKLKGEMGGKEDDKNKVREKPRKIEEELVALRRQKEKEEEEKQKYFEEQKKRKEEEKREQEDEYNDSLSRESTNPAKQKKSRGSAFINKKQRKPDITEMSATAEFKGNKVQ